MTIWRGGDGHKRRKGIQLLCVLCLFVAHESTLASRPADTCPCLPGVVHPVVRDEGAEIVIQNSNTPGAVWRIHWSGRAKTLS